MTTGGVHNNEKPTHLVIANREVRSGKQSSITPFWIGFAELVNSVASGYALAMTNRIM
jgi:hypothetical protein